MATNNINCKEVSKNSDMRFYLAEWTNDRKVTIPGTEKLWKKVKISADIWVTQPRAFGNWEL